MPSKPFNTLLVTGKGIALYGGQKKALSMEDKIIALSHEQMCKIYIWYTDYLRQEIKGQLKT